MRIETAQRTKVTTRIRLSIEDIVRMLKDTSTLIIPCDAAVTVEVPTGGAYSGCVLSVHELVDACVTVSWTTTEAR